jgi:hypothetical protein
LILKEATRFCSNNSITSHGKLLDSITLTVIEFCAFPFLPFPPIVPRVPSLVRIRLSSCIWTIGTLIKKLLSFQEDPNASASPTK